MHNLRQPGDIDSMSHDAALPSGWWVAPFALIGFAMWVAILRGAWRWIA